MTSIEWLLEQLKDYDFLLSLHQYDIEKAKEMHKVEIIDAHLDGQSLVSCKDEYAEQYYQETFGSKESDAKDVVLGYISLDAQMLDSQLPQTTSDKWKEYQDWLNEPPEISDEEIEKAARDYDNGDIYGPPLVNFEQGAFWYREQLKQK